MTWAVHVSLAPSWFDPAETPSVITPFMMLYALHDALVKPMPGNAMAPSLAESWTVSRDGFAYEFVLRKGVRFHNGDPVTAEDVKFSLERYRGGGATTLKERVAADFMTFYGTPATGGSAAPGNAETRIEAFVITGGIRAYGGYPDIDGLFREQAAELDPKRREALLHRIQQLMHAVSCSRRSSSRRS